MWMFNHLGTPQNNLGTPLVVPTPSLWTTVLGYCNSPGLLEAYTESNKKLFNMLCLPQRPWQLSPVVALCQCYKAKPKTRILREVGVRPPDWRHRKCTETQVTTAHIRDTTAQTRRRGKRVGVLLFAMEERTWMQPLNPSLGLYFDSWAKEK